MLFRIVYTRHKKDGRTQVYDLADIAPYSVFPNRERAKEVIEETLKNEIAFYTEHLKTKPRLSINRWKGGASVSIPARNGKKIILTELRVYEVETEADNIGTKSEVRYCGFVLTPQDEGGFLMVNTKNEEYVPRTVSNLTVGMRAVDEYFRVRNQEREEKKREAKKQKRRKE